MFSGVTRASVEQAGFLRGDSTLNYQTALVTIDLLNRSGAAVGIVTR
jgi:hypothetical protein